MGSDRPRSVVARSWIGAGIALVLVVGGCSGSHRGEAVSDRGGPPASNQSSSWTGGCDANSVRRIVDRFVAAYNSRDLDAALNLFAVSDFRWYSDSPWRDELAASKAATPDPLADPRNRSTLGPYLTRKWREGDRFKVETFQYNGYDNGYGNFGMELMRPGGTSIGKGALSCESMKLIVWSLGIPR